jgi:hypothetical protein
MLGARLGFILTARTKIHHYSSDNVSDPFGSPSVPFVPYLCAYVLFADATYHLPVNADIKTGINENICSFALV